MYCEEIHSFPLNATSVKFTALLSSVISLPCDLGDVLNGQEKWSIRAESMEVDPGCRSAAFGLWFVQKKPTVAAL